MPPYGHHSEHPFQPIYPVIQPEQAEMGYIDAASSNRFIFSGLKEGKSYCFRGTWGTAMAFYSWLKKQVSHHYPANDYTSSRWQREKLVALTEHLYIHITDHQPTLIKAPGNTWLKEFYPNQKEFYLRFSDYLGMNGAKQWYEKGIRLPGLNHPIHPYYGTYFPTRYEHLVLFDQWLSGQNAIRQAIDMGTGCGAIVFYLMKHGAQKITATDINPNALYSLFKDLKRQGFQTQLPPANDFKSNPHTSVTLHTTKKGSETPEEEGASVKPNVEVKIAHTTFFKNLGTSEPEILIFNPPWLPQTSHSVIDKAMYYDADFFDTFFSQAYSFMLNQSAMVLLFSNFAQAAGITSTHPIEEELNKEQRFVAMDKLEKSIQPSSSGRKSWLAEIREKEKAELWVLKKR